MYLDPDFYRGIRVDLSIKEERSIRGLIGLGVRYKVHRQLTSIIECHVNNWIGVYYDSVKAGLRFPLMDFIVAFCKFYGVLPAQITPNAHRILACVPQICRRHRLPSSIKLFNFLYTVKLGGKKTGGDYVMVQCRQSVGKIDGLPDNNKGWKGKFFKVRLDDAFPFDRVWLSQVCKCKQPAETSGLKEAFRWIGSESYDWDTYHSPDALLDAGLDRPSWEIAEEEVNQAVGGRQPGGPCPVPNTCAFHRFYSFLTSFCFAGAQKWVLTMNLRPCSVVMPRPRPGPRSQRRSRSP